MAEQNMIDRLRGAEVAERVQIIETLYQKNMTFLKKRFPATVALFKNITCPYRFDLTDSFLNIIHEPSGELSHPEVGLDLLSGMLGDWVHDTWVDLFNFRVVAPDRYPVHFQTIKDMHRQLMVTFPEYPVTFAQRKINLKELPDGRRFSPPVVFLGIFHGLHIDFFLSRTELSTLLLLEPEPERFEVSCYFLDYEAIYERFENVHIGIGPDVDAQPVRDFFSSYRISPQMWTRVLPAYASERHRLFIEAFKMHQTTLASVIYPIEFEVLGIQHALQNITEHLPLLSYPPKLSRKSRIAIVATGPSLDADLPWLKRNREKVIIFAVASAVSSLNAYGIKPDIQFTLELNMLVGTLMNLEMSSDVATIASFKVNKQTTDFFRDNIYLCATQDKASPIEADCKIPNSSPSTTNFVFSFACLCKPKEILMLGCDFGYHSIERHHSKSSVYKNQSFGTQTKDMSQILMAGNFGNKDCVQSNPFLTHTRLIVERSIQEAGRGITVFNLSDGAKVGGARSKRSKHLKLKFYKEKNKDLQKIFKTFGPAEEGGNYQQYACGGVEMLEKLKKEVLGRVTLEEFSWVAFSAAVDAVVYDSVKRCQESESDLRLDIFSRLLIDLMCTWYSTIIFFDADERVEEVYRKGLDLVAKAINDFSWVEDLEFLTALQGSIPGRVAREDGAEGYFTDSFEETVYSLLMECRSVPGAMIRDSRTRLFIDHLASWYAQVIGILGLGMAKQRNNKTVRILKEVINLMVRETVDPRQEEVAELLAGLKTALEQDP